MLIMAIDPGTTAGSVLAEIAREDINPYVIRHDEVDMALMLDMAWAFCNRQGEEHRVIVCEAFSYRTGRTQTAQYAHLETIGALRWMCRQRGVRFVLQKVSDAKQIKDVREYVRGGDGHARDAARHLILFCQALEPKDFEVS
jgi:hypothetical protein